MTFRELTLREAQEVDIEEVVQALPQELRDDLLMAVPARQIQTQVFDKPIFFMASRSTHQRLFLHPRHPDVQGNGSTARRMIPIQGLHACIICTGFMWRCGRLRIA